MGTSFDLPWTVYAAAVAVLLAPPGVVFVIVLRALGRGLRRTSNRAVADRRQ